MFRAGLSAEISRSSPSTSVPVPSAQAFSHKPARERRVRPAPNTAAESSDTAAMLASPHHGLCIFTVRASCFPPMFSICASSAYFCPPARRSSVKGEIIPLCPWNASQGHFSAQHQDFSDKRRCACAFCRFFSAAARCFSLISRLTGGAIFNHVAGTLQ